MTPATPAQRVRLLELAGAMRKGVWRSADGQWTFARHHSDPFPQRWFAFHESSMEPFWDGTGDTMLAEVVQRVEEWVKEK